MCGDREMSYNIDGFDELMEMFKELEKSPRQAIKKGARKAGMVLKREAKQLAPQGKTKQLKKGIVLVNGKARGQARFFVDVKYNPSMNAIFQRQDKPIKQKGKYGGTNDYPYYPESIESGRKGANGKTEGKHILATAFDNVKAEAESVMMETIVQGVDNILQKQRQSGGE
jgi:hypothetical protein